MKSYSKDDGALNTNKIKGLYDLSAVKNCAERTYYKHDNEPVDGWYLPSVNELWAIMGHEESLDLAISDEWIWSSTEFDANQAYGVMSNISTPDSELASKTQSGYCLCVKKKQD